MILVIIIIKKKNLKKLNSIDINNYLFDKYNIIFNFLLIYYRTSF